MGRAWIAVAATVNKPPILPIKGNSLPMTADSCGV